MANGGLLNATLSQMLNPRMPAQSTFPGDDEDDMRRVQSILGGLDQPEARPPLLESILAGVLQAIAIGTSQNPSETLQRQMDQRVVLEEKAKDKRDRIKQLGAQLQIEDIISRGRERRQEAKEVRAEGRLDVRDLGKFNREMFGKLQLEGLSQKNNKELLDIKNFYDIENLKTQFSNNKELENLRSSNNRTEQRIGNELSFVVPLMYSGMFSGKDAAEIYDKIAKGEKLTDDESKRIGKAAKALRDEKYRHELNLARTSRAGGSGGSSALSKGIEWANTRAAATVLGRDAQGGIHELSRNPITGEFAPSDPNVKIDKFLSEQDEFKYYFDYYVKTNPEAAGLSNLFGTTTTLPDDKTLALKLDDVIKVARDKDRESDATIIQKLNDPAVQQKLGVTSQQVQEAVSRNKLNPTSTEKPLRPMADPKGMASGSQLFEGTSSAPSRDQIAKKVEKDKAARTIDKLNKKLLKKIEELDETPPKQGSMEYRSKLQHEIVDLSNRLEVAYQAHPDLRPK